MAAIAADQTGQGTRADRERVEQRRPEFPDARRLTRPEALEVGAERLQAGERARDATEDVPAASDDGQAVLSRVRGRYPPPTTGAGGKGGTEKGKEV